MSDCKYCGRPFDPSDRNYSGSGHFNPYTCISNLRARAEAAEAEAAALRARVAELEAEHYALRQQLITAAQAALPGDVTITRMIVGWTDRLTGPQHIVLISDEEE